MNRHEKMIGYRIYNMMWANIFIRRLTDVWFQNRFKIEVWWNSTIVRYLIISYYKFKFVLRGWQIPYSTRQWFHFILMNTSVVAFVPVVFSTQSPYVNWAIFYNCLVTSNFTINEFFTWHLRTMPWQQCESRGSFLLSKSSNHMCGCFGSYGYMPAIFDCGLFRLNSSPLSMTAAFQQVTSLHHRSVSFG